MIKLVLATDVGQHFEILSAFNAKMSKKIDMSDRGDRYQVLAIAIKCSDISNPAKPRRLCKDWCSLISEEMYLQGDEERRLGLPVSPFMDRQTADIPKNQVGFIEIICMPLYQALAEFNSAYEEQTEYLIQNRDAWAKEVEAEDDEEQIEVVAEG
eukprot:TRINITY_DN2047_c0_g1_i2.p1 TRINITY_DN2047_c0_g1~~TRINITY_DN2047_c0_g1_i2.p1  ORF type:complete len:155 (-),score=41.83 TRINITY_DN2047_c0_g1_i2:47-511(-)